MSVFYTQNTHVFRLEDSQEWVNKRGLGGLAISPLERDDTKP